MIKPKVHSAGLPANGKQKCVRCHAVLGTEGYYWSPGAFVLSKYNGMRAIDVLEAIKLPRCGRGNPVPLDLPNDPVNGLMRERIREAEGRG